MFVGWLQLQWVGGWDGCCWMLLLLLIVAVVAVVAAGGDNIGITVVSKIMFC